MSSDYKRVIAEKIKGKWYWTFRAQNREFSFTRNELERAEKRAKKRKRGRTYDLPIRSRKT